MRELLGWNMNLGRWAGVQVRLHVFFVLLAVATVLATRNEQWDFAWCFTFLGVLLASVVLHEAGHCLAAFRLGGSPTQVVLWPFGGLSPASTPPDPIRECIVALAGPAVSLMVCFAAAFLLLLQGSGIDVLLNPFTPPPPEVSAPLAALALEWTFWINLWMLVAINLLPAYPMDGGRALRAFLGSVFSPPRAMLISCWAAQVTGLALCLLAWWVPQFAQLPLVLLGLLLFFTARYETAVATLAPRTEDLDHGFDLSREEPQRLHDGHDGTGASAVSPTSQVREWIENRREEKLRQQREMEEEEDRMVDEILSHVHEVGFDGLSAEERALLKRAGTRYRNRSSQ